MDWPVRDVYIFSGGLANGFLLYQPLAGGETIYERASERERVERIKAYVVACICNFCSYVRTPAVQSLAILGRK